MEKSKQNTHTTHQKIVVYYESRVSPVNISSRVEMRLHDLVGGGGTKWREKERGGGEDATSNSDVHVRNMYNT